MHLRARKHDFDFPGPALVMGILNVTPDSFSDGGKYLDFDKALEHALRMEKEGAGIIDVGGESTRPGAAPVIEVEELRRVVPLITVLAKRLRIPISIDTMKVEVARQAVAAGACIINDVGANQHKPGMWRLAADTGCAYVAMHMQGTPHTMQQDPHYADVTREVHLFLQNKIKELGGCGVPQEQIILDPGIGFGKTAEHNLQLLAGLARFADFGRPLLVGVSRKSFLGAKDGAPHDKRLPAGIACACLAVQSGAQIIRTHDVAETLQAVRMTEEILAR